MKKYFLLGLLIAIVPNVCLAESARYTQLVREKQRKMEELEKCMGTTKGLKIAGISTLGITAVGVAGNIVEAKKIKDYKTDIEKTDKQIDKTQSELNTTTASIETKKAEIEAAKLKAEAEEKAKAGQIQIKDNTQVGTVVNADGNKDANLAELYTKNCSLTNGSMQDGKCVCSNGMTAEKDGWCGVGMDDKQSNCYRSGGDWIYGQCSCNGGLTQPDESGMCGEYKEDWSEEVSKTLKESLKDDCTQDAKKNDFNVVYATKNGNKCEIVSCAQDLKPSSDKSRCEKQDNTVINTEFNFEFEEEQPAPTPEMIIYEQQKNNCKAPYGQWINNKCQCAGGYHTDNTGTCVLNDAVEVTATKPSNDQLASNCKAPYGQWVNNKCQCAGGYHTDNTGTCVLNDAVEVTAAKPSNSNTVVNASTTPNVDKGYHKPCTDEDFRAANLTGATEGWYYNGKCVAKTCDTSKGYEMAKNAKGASNGYCKKASTSSATTSTTGTKTTQPATGSTASNGTSEVKIVVPDYQQWTTMQVDSVSTKNYNIAKDVSFKPTQKVQHGGCDSNPGSGHWGRCTCWATGYYKDFGNLGDCNAKCNDYCTSGYKSETVIRAK